jgi:hypothetical protein
MNFEQNFEKFRTHKNSNTGPLCIIDPEYGVLGQQIWSFGHFLPQLAIFG